MTYLKNLPYLLYYATLALLSLAGCKSLPLDQIPMKAEWNTPKDIFFTIKPNDNGKEPLNFTASEVDSIIRGQWSTKSISALRSSRLPERTKYTLLFILATREIVEKNNSCENLELVSVDMYSGPRI